MRAITIHQPWAHAIAHLGKDIENRTWNFAGGELAIHAGQRYDVDAEAFIVRFSIELPPNLARGAIIGLVDVAEVHRADRCRGVCSKWAMAGPYHWYLTDVRPLAEPVACRGGQGIWPVPDDKAELVRQRLAEQAVDVAPEAEVPLARLLVDMATVLARLEGHDLADVRIGPVDFGPEHYEGEIDHDH